jgi:unsaturated chondroitin disaccharide hydrolase
MTARLRPLVATAALILWWTPSHAAMPAADPALITRGEISTAFSSAEIKLAFLADRTLNNNPAASVAYTDSAGRWLSRNTSVWTSGHLAGTFWMLYARTGKAEWRTRAERWTQALESRITAADNDTGFQIFCSYGLGFTLGGVDTPAYHSALTNAASELLSQRYNATIGCLRSWPERISNPTEMPFEVNIDQLMNLELILYAAQQLNRPDMVEKVLSHADRTWAENHRADASTYHVVEYDAQGGVVTKRTHQGWQNSSTWSRGQAWAVYGYVMIYRYTGEQRFLDRSIASLNYFTAAVAAQSNDGIAYSDFDAALNSSNPRDTSASAIVAAACMELYQHTGDDSYRSTAGRILGTLHRSYQTHQSSHQAVLAAASEKWGLGEVGAIFGDYYYLEALMRFDATLPPPDPVPLTAWAGFPVVNQFFADTGPLLGAVYTGFAPWIYLFHHERWVWADPDASAGSGLWIRW